MYDICLKKYEKKDNRSWNEIALSEGYNSGDQLRSSFRRVHEKLIIESFEDNEDSEQTENTNSTKESSTYKEGRDFINVICASERILSKDDIVERFNIDLNLWDIDSFEIHTSEGYRKDRKVDWHVEDGKVTKGDVEDSGKLLIAPMYHITVKFKQKKEKWTEKNLDKLFENLTQKDLTHFSYTPNYVKNGKMLFLPIADLHLGLLSTDKTSGNEYNIQIAKDRCEQVISQILARINNEKFEKINLILGNDFLNSDNIAGTTVKGTPQDGDLFWYEMTDSAVDIIIKTINSLISHAPIDVYSVYSNHDEQSMYGIMRMVQFYYKDDKNVKINATAMPRTYLQYGKSLIGLSHDIPLKRSLEIITTEAKDKWSNSTHMYWILAHLHQAMVYDKQGFLEIYRLPTISGWSRWTNKQGYVQTEKKTQCFIFDKEYGITDIMNIVVE